jgi:hypothetical protein
MRTAFSLDGDVLREVKAYAKRWNVTIDKAISDLVRRGPNAHLRTRVVNGIHVVDLPPDSPVVSSEHVRKLRDQSE